MSSLLESWTLNKELVSRIQDIQVYCKTVGGVGNRTCKAQRANPSGQCKMAEGEGETVTGRLVRSLLEQKHNDA